MLKKGANGAGKSTLIRLILGELPPINGICHLQNSVSVGYFAQHHMELLDYSATPLEHLKNVFGNATIQQIYAQLGRFNLGNELAKQRIGTLSGGQKSRVAFAILTWYSPHLVIMDEPTNHLDLPTIDALAIALSGFEGLCLSHYAFCFFFVGFGYCFVCFVMRVCMCVHREGCYVHIVSFFEKKKHVLLLCVKFQMKCLFFLLKEMYGICCM